MQRSSLCRRASIACLSVVAALTALGAEGPRTAVNLAALKGWDIVTAEKPSPSDAYAAEEFQRFFEKASGVTLPRVTSTERPAAHIFIGASPAMRASPSGFAVDAFGPEDLRIVIGDDTIVIAGGAPRGTLYGVYAFLEDYLGVRFLTAEHTHVPPLGAWRAVGPVDRFFHPTFAMRWTYYGEINRTPDFAARLRINTVTNDAKLGGITGIQNVSHSFFAQIPSGVYGKEHPEYFALRDGKRLAPVGNDGYETEPCLTNPDVLRIVTESVRKTLDGNPQLANVSVSQNDNDRCCTCEKCAALDAAEETPMGSLLTFVNAVADEIARTHPKIAVGTLSYWYTRKPPKTIKPRPNVQIQLCSIECCLIHRIDDPACPQNAVFCRDMRNWGAICNNISIWNYNTNFTNYLLPCPNLRVIEPNVRFFAANNAKGVFMQCPGDAWAAELSELRNYIISSLIWDPSRSGAQLCDEFLALHYGQAAPAIRRYIDLIHDTAEKSGLHRNCFAGRAADYGLTQETAERALALFQEARRCAESPAIAARVDKASVAAYRLAIEPVWGCENPATLDPVLRARMRPLVARFLELCQAHRVDRASEGNDFANARARLAKIAEPGPDGGKLVIAVPPSADGPAIQAAVDRAAAAGGGIVKLSAGRVVLRNALTLRSGVSLVGVPGQTVLAACDGATSRLLLDGDANERQLTLAEPAAFRAGDGVVVKDSRYGGGFTVTTATLAEPAGAPGAFKLSQPLYLDYMVANEATASLAFPVVAGWNVEDVALEGLTIDGNRAKQSALDGCRGGGIYLFECARVAVRNCVVRGYHGDGISFQVSADVTVEDCLAEGNAGLGIHPGSGSSRPIVRRNRSLGNDRDGLFVCWRVTQGRFEDNELRGNGGVGVSIGHKDSDNKFTGNTIANNAAGGILFRNESQPMGAHRNVFEGNTILDNGKGGEPCIRIRGHHHNLVFRNNTIGDSAPGQKARVGIACGPEALGLESRDNRFQNVAKEVETAGDSPR